MVIEVFRLPLKAEASDEVILTAAREVTVASSPVDDSSWESAEAEDYVPPSDDGTAVFLDVQATAFMDIAGNLIIIASIITITARATGFRCSRCRFFAESQNI